VLMGIAKRHLIHLTSSAAQVLFAVARLLLVLEAAATILTQRLPTVFLTFVVTFEQLDTQVLVFVNTLGQTHSVQVPAMSQAQQLSVAVFFSHLVLVESYLYSP